MMLFKRVPGPNANRIAEAEYSEGQAWGSILHLSDERRPYSDEIIDINWSRLGRSPTRYLFGEEDLIPKAIETRTNGMANSDVTSQMVWSAAYINAAILQDTYSAGVIQPNSRLYYLQNANWDTTAVVGFNSTTGTWGVTQRYVYSPYGSMIVLNSDFSTPPAGTQPLVSNLYQGMTLDVVTGLYDERFRNYSPSLGTWISQDPLSYVNGANTYQFVMGNPVGMVDPKGLTGEPPPTGWTIAQISLAARGAKLAAEGVRSYIKGHEGLRLTRYIDTKHKATIGYGHNLATARGRARLLRVLKADGRAHSYKAILRGKCKITREEAEKLFQIDFRIARRGAARDFSNFLQLPAEVKKALLDMEFNLGSVKWPLLRGAIKSGRWHEAAIQVLQSKYAGQLPNRADDNAGLIFDYALFVWQANQDIQFITGRR